MTGRPKQTGLIPYGKIHDAQKTDKKSYLLPIPFLVDRNPKYITFATINNRRKEDHEKSACFTIRGTGFHDSPIRCPRARI